MKYTKFSPLIVAPLLWAASAWPQATDWNAVRYIPLETKIHVTLNDRHSFGHCFFEGIRDDGALVCRPRGPLGLASRRYVFPRERVKGVYLAHNGPLIGAGVGAAAGAMIGASKPGCCRGAQALIDAGLLAMPGIIIGAALDPFFHGRAIYRSSSDPQKSRNNSAALAYDGKEEIQAAKTQIRNRAEVEIPCLRDGSTNKCVEEPSEGESTSQTSPN